MIYLTGDTHSDVRRFSSEVFPAGKDLTKRDYMIILGDFGLIWNKDVSSDYEKYWINWLSEKPWTTLFLDGNHENFDRLDKLPQMKMLSGEVGIVSDSIFHLKRGEIYNIEGIRLFTFGGANSIDKAQRVENVSWWSRELPNFAEYDHALENLEKHDWDVNLILTHDAPESIYDIIAQKYFSTKRPNYDLPKFLEEVKKKTQFESWVFGHFHINDTFEKRFTCLYEKIVLLE
jgi:predicted phosphodiesterase